MVRIAVSLNRDVRRRRVVATVRRPVGVDLYRSTACNTAVPQLAAASPKGGRPARMQYERHPVRAVPAICDAKRKGDDERFDIAWELEKSASCLAWDILREGDDAILLQS